MTRQGAADRHSADPQTSLPGKRSTCRWHGFPTGASLKLALATLALVSTVLPARADGGTLPDPGDPGFAFKRINLPDDLPEKLWDPVIANAGRIVLAGTTGPDVWTSADGARTWSGPSELRVTGGRPCTYAPIIGTIPASGEGDVAVGADGTLYALQSCGGWTAELVWRSTDGGITWSGTDGGLPAIADVESDRVTIGADPVTPGVVYVVTSSAPAPFAGDIAIWKSTDAGRTFVPHLVDLPPRTPEQASHNGPVLHTRPIVDPTDPNRVYVLWTAEDLRTLTTLQGSTLNDDTDYEGHTKAFVAVSTDGGTSWTVKEILDTGDPPPGPTTHHSAINDIANWLPSAAIDDAGNVYFAFVEDTAGSGVSHLMLMRTTDHGPTWSAPIQVDKSGLRSAFAPGIAAGRAGHVGMTWFGSTASSQQDPQAQWSVEYAWSGNADGTAPEFRQTRVSGSEAVHVGCLIAESDCGLAQAFISIAEEGSGQAVVFYLSGDDATPQVVVARQTSGPLLGASVERCDDPARRRRSSASRTVGDLRTRLLGLSDTS